MELRELAERILLSQSLADKLAPFEGKLTDENPGPPQRLVEPARPDNLRLRKRLKGAKMPHRQAFYEERLRGVAHHIMANHELQALEVMAWTLLAFPDAPTEFRYGIVRVMADEQRHTRMHLARLKTFGMEFGSVPVSGYVWRRSMASESILDYLACLPLTFEGGNLDHSIEFRDAFLDANDGHSASVMQIIHDDEIDHVRFGIEWLRKLKPAELSDWQTYLDHLHWPLGPHHAQGIFFDNEARRSAGLSDDFITELRHVREQHWGPKEENTAKPNQDPQGNTAPSENTGYDASTHDLELE